MKISRHYPFVLCSLKCQAHNDLKERSSSIKKSVMSNCISYPSPKPSPIGKVCKSIAFMLYNHFSIELKMNLNICSGL